jgi:hypothetical protein
MVSECFWSPSNIAPLFDGDQIFSIAQKRNGGKGMK